MRGKIEELLFIKVTVFLPLSFRKKNSAKQDIASTEIAYQFLAPKVPVLRRNKATNPSTSTDPFSAATKTFVLGNLFKLVRSAITFARAVCIGGNEKNTRRLSYFPSSLSPSGKVPVRMWWSKSMNKLPSTRAFILVQLKNGCLYNTLELMAIFLLKTETCDAKNCWEFFVDAIFCFVKIGFDKRWTDTKRAWWMEVL